MKINTNADPFDRLIRFGGFLFFLFGLLAIILRLTQFVLLGDPPMEMLVISKPFLWLQGIPSLLAAVFFVVGVSSLYLRQARKVGTSGLVIYLISVSLLIISSGAMWTYTFTAPVLAREAPSLLTSSSSAIVVATLGSMVLGQVGWLLMAIQAYMANVIPRWAAIIALVGIALVVVLTPFAQTQLLRLIYNLLLGIGPVVIGFVLWRDINSANG
jgi:hypothetical protein